MSRKELPSLVTRDTEPSFHLAAFMRSDMYQWLYEHFVNVSLRCESVAFYEWTDNYIDQSYRYMYENRHTYQFNEIKSDINAFIRNMVNNDYYIFTYIDRYHITTNDYYKQYHFVHPLMITGYDDKEGFICIDFDPRHGPLKVIISYDEFDIAFADCEKYYDCGAYADILKEIAICIKLNNSFIASGNSKRRQYAHYTFSINRFISELHDYLYGVVRAGVPYEPFKFGSVRLVYGIHTYDELLRYFDIFVENRYSLRFKTLHDFTLHKWMLQTRLNYVADMYDISETCREAIIEYNEVYKKAERLRLLNIKCNMRDHIQINSLSYNQEFVNAFKKIIPELREMEISILSRVYNELKNGAERKNAKLVQYVNYERASTKGGEQIIFNEVQSIHRIDIILSPDIPENSCIKLTFDSSDYTEYILQPEHIKRRYAVIDIYPIQHTENLTITADTNIEFGKFEYRFYTRSNELNWNFNENRFDNVYPVSDLRFDHSINAELIGNDPSIWMKADFFADDLKYIIINYRTCCRSNIAEIRFTDEMCGIYEKRFTVAPTDEIYEYIVDMSDHPDWKGRIQVLRFDPISYDNEDERGDCVIESIKLSSQLPVYRSSDQFVAAQGLNGWSYHTFNEDVTYREMVIDENGVHAIEHNEITISSCEQTSAVQLASARIWTCPACGTYKVNCNAVLTTDGKQCKFSIKHNHTPIYVSEKLIQDQQNEYDETLTLEKGETLRFEFYNHNQNTVETLNISVAIEKQHT